MAHKTLKILLLLGIFCLSQPVFALFFHLDGEHLWLEAENVPIRDVLEQFSRLGVEVRMDPRIQKPISARIKGKELDKALPTLLDPCDYLLTWKMLRGPLGRIPKLHSIQVFMPGQSSAARPISEKPVIFQVTRGVSSQSPEFVPDELLIGVRPGTSYGPFKALMDAIGGVMVEADPTTGVYLIRFAPGTNVEAILEQIAHNSMIAHAELNYVTRLPTSQSSSLPVIPPVQPPADGAIPVAVLDSGLDPRAGLSPLVTGAWDAVNPSRPLGDSQGHGTQMAVLAAGLLAADGAGATGNALPLVCVRAFDDEGKTSNFAILQALTYARQAGAKVVNMSWGSSTDSQFLRAAMQMAANQGMLLVAAAGNEPTGRPVYPAAYPEVIAIGGTTAAGRAWEQSNHGDFISLSAPAFATLPANSGSRSGGYVGTSIASAVVAHALAKYLNQHPRATPAEAREALLKALSAPPAPSGYGAGTLDAPALHRLLTPNASPPAP